MSFWQLWLYAVLANVAVGAFIIWRNGASEGTAWLVFLVIPMILAALALGRFVFGLVFD